jgi:hypothetical protein
VPAVRLASVMLFSVNDEIDQAAPSNVAISSPVYGV